MASAAETERRIRAHAHFATGTIYDQQGDAAKAEEEYRQAAEADPANEGLVVDLAGRLIQHEAFDQAGEVLSRSAARPEASGLVHGWLALVRVRQSREAEGLASARLAIRKAPKLLLGYQVAVQVLFKRKDTKEALRLLDQAAREPEVDSVFLADLAGLLGGAQLLKDLKPEEAVPRMKAVLHRASQLKPEDPAVLRKMAETYRAIGELQRATELLGELIRKLPSQAPMLRPALREELFQLYLRTGDRKGAAEQLKALLQDNPTNPQLNFLLGGMAAEDKDFKVAEGYLEKAILFNQELEPAYYELAAVRLSLREPERALEILIRARDRFRPGFVMEYYTAMANMALKRYEEAVNRLTSAELLAKNSEPDRLTAMFYFQVGAAHERAGHLPEAERALNHALELAPDDTETLNYLGYMWADKGIRLDEAKALIERALKQEPKNAAFLDSLAWVLFRQRKYDEALVQMDAAFANLKEPDATIYDHYGDILAALNRMDEARKAWAKSLELEANDEVRRKLEGKPSGDH